MLHILKEIEKQYCMYEINRIEFRTDITPIQTLIICVRPPTL